MSRYQSGHIYEASGAFLVRYYLSEIVDAKPTRVQRSYRLCDKDDTQPRSRLVVKESPGYHNYR
jgi:hypothetical protein